MPTKRKRLPIELKIDNTWIPEVKFSQDQIERLQKACSKPEYIEAVHKGIEQYVFDSASYRSGETLAELKRNVDSIEAGAIELERLLTCCNVSRALFESAPLSENQFTQAVDLMKIVPGWDGPTSLAGKQMLSAGDKFLRYLVDYSPIVRRRLGNKVGRPKNEAAFNLHLHVYALLHHHGIMPTAQEDGPFVETLSVAYEAAGQNLDETKDIASVAKRFLDSLNLKSTLPACQK